MLESFKKERGYKYEEKVISVYDKEMLEFQQYFERKYKVKVTAPACMLLPVLIQQLKTENVPGFFSYHNNKIRYTYKIEIFKPVKRAVDFDFKKNNINKNTYEGIMFYNECGTDLSYKDIIDKKIFLDPEKNTFRVSATRPGYGIKNITDFDNADDAVKEYKRINPFRGAGTVHLFDETEEIMRRSEDGGLTCQ